MHLQNRDSHFAFTRIRSMTNLLFLSSQPNSSTSLCRERLSSHRFYHTLPCAITVVLGCFLCTFAQSHDERKLSFFVRILADIISSPFATFPKSSAVCSHLMPYQPLGAITTYPRSSTLPSISSLIWHSPHTTYTLSITMLTSNSSSQSQASPARHPMPKTTPYPS